MPYNFDLVPNRRDPNVINKWTYYPNDALPMWLPTWTSPRQNRS